MAFFFFKPFLTPHLHPFFALQHLFKAKTHPKKIHTHTHKHVPCCLNWETCRQKRLVSWFSGFDLWERQGSYTGMVHIFDVISGNGEYLPPTYLNVVFNELFIIIIIISMNNSQYSENDEYFFQNMDLFLYFHHTDIGPQKRNTVPRHHLKVVS